MPGMNTTRITQPGRIVLPSYRHLLVFFLPLALSSSMMTLEPLIINTALARAANAELALAAYSVVFSIALVVEAPVIMLVSAATALGRSRAAFRRLFRFMLLLGGATVAIGFFVALTPLYNWLVVDIMQVPVEVARVARPAQIVMSIWSFPVAWRRTLQGVLIAHDHTPIVAAATVVRVTGLVVALWIGSLLIPDRMLLAAAIAMQVSVLAEAIFVTPSALRVARSLPEQGDKPLFSWRWLIAFYQPLAVMTLLRMIARPVLTAGVAAAQMPQRSLAAWSVVWSVTMLPFGVTMGLEQVAIAKGTGPAAMARVRRFVWGVGLVLSAVLALLFMTPLVRPVLALAFDLAPDMEPLVIMGLRWLVLMPVLQSLQGLLRGNAIGQERTRDTRTALAVALVATAAVTVLGPRLTTWSGVFIGVAITILAAVAETGWLAWRERRAPAG